MGEVGGVGKEKEVEDKSPAGSSLCGISSWFLPLLLPLQRPIPPSAGSPTGSSAMALRPRAPPLLVPHALAEVRCGARLAGGADRRGGGSAAEGGGADARVLGSSPAAMPATGLHSPAASPAPVVRGAPGGAHGVASGVGARRVRRRPVPATFPAVQLRRRPVLAATPTVSSPAA